jgi:L-iditol 2-dehydrogenase
MRAARLYGVGDIRVADEPTPEVGPGEALVQVSAVGLCGSDLHWFSEGAIGDAQLSHPLVLGHEAAGVIASGSRQGQRVAIDPAIPDETCRACRDGYRNLCPQVRFSGHGDTDGALREFMAWPAGLLHPLPDELSDSDGAILEPLGVAVHSVDLGHLPFAGTAAVIGCGPIGLLTIQLLRASGAASIVAFDPLAHRREAAAKLGADQVVDPAQLSATDGGTDGTGRPGEVGLPSAERVRELVGYGVDVAFEIAGGDPAVALAMEAVRPGGRVTLGGIPDDDHIGFSAALARRKGLTIALVRRMNEVYPRAISLVAQGRVDTGPLVTDRFGLDEVATAFGTAVRRAGHKIVVEPGR